MRLYQKPLDDDLFRRSASARMALYFRPTEEQKANARWAVCFERIDEDGDMDFASSAHVIPIFDIRIHQVSADCECGPTYCEDRDCWEHNAVQ